MLRNCLLLVAIGLLPLPAILQAKPIDPGIIVDSTDPPAINLFGVTNGINGVQPTGDAAVVYQLEDNTGIIQSLTFDLTINTGLPQKDIRNGFSCGQNGRGYFLHCTITYDPNTGDLKYMFFGVRPPEGDELCPQKDCEVNEQEGIPPGGTFFVHLNGWVSDATVGDPDTLYSGLPEFSNSFVATPEPSALWVVGIALLLLASVVELRRRRNTRLGNLS